MKALIVVLASSLWLLSSSAAGANDLPASSMLRTGLLTSRLVELTDKPDELASPASQMMVDRSFQSLEIASQSPRLRSFFASLRQRFNQMSSADERAEDLRRLDMLRNALLAEHSEQEASQFLLGGLIQQVYYNATALKDADADEHMRMRIVQVGTADGLYADFATLRSELGQVERGDFARVSTLSKRLVTEIDQ